MARGFNDFAHCDVFATHSLVRFAVHLAHSRHVLLNRSGSSLPSPFPRDPVPPKVVMHGKRATADALGDISRAEPSLPILRVQPCPIREPAILQRLGPDIDSRLPESLPDSCRRNLECLRDFLQRAP